MALFDIDPILIGVTVLLAGAAIGGTALLPPKMRAGSFYAQLAVMVGIYVGFAIIGLDPLEEARRADWSALIIESIFALAFLMAGLGALYSNKAWIIGVLILIHGGVDVGHLVLGANHSPDWYEFLCSLYDAIVGFAAVALLSGPTAKI